MKLPIKNSESLIWYGLALVFLAILLVSIVDSVKVRLKVRDIEREVNRRVEQELKWYEDNLQHLNKELQRYKVLYEKSRQEAMYYRRIYRRMQEDKLRIALPKSSRELRERFRRLGYEPVN
ncbi:MAG: hypothetical protein DRJ47_06485 [Thermoprotei archaeon]|nr:MAG: hypothetical protein DRJ47_06485 [Thermoprotei archaeon]